MCQGYAVFLPRRSAIASISGIGKLVILAVKAIEAPSFKAFSAISFLSCLLTSIVHEFCYNNPRTAVLFRCNTAALIYKFIWFLLSVQHSDMTEMKTVCLICLKH